MMETLRQTRQGRHTNGSVLIWGFLFFCFFFFCFVPVNCWTHHSNLRVRQRVSKSNAICDQRSANLSPKMITLKNERNSLMMAILLGRYKFGRGTQTKAVKTGPFSLKLSSCISSYLMLDLYNSNCSERVAIVHWVEIANNSVWIPVYLQFPK